MSGTQWVGHNEWNTMSGTQWYSQSDKSKECKLTFQFNNLTNYGHGPPEDDFKRDRNM